MSPHEGEDGLADGVERTSVYEPDGRDMVYLRKKGRRGRLRPGGRRGGGLEDDEAGDKRKTPFTQHGHFKNVGLEDDGLVIRRPKPDRKRMGLEDDDDEMRPGLMERLGLINGTGHDTGLKGRHGYTNGLKGRGLTNGLKGKGYTNGLKGSGLTNGVSSGKRKGLRGGRGLTNGTGLTNGMGLINGAGLTNGLKRRLGLINGNGLINGTGLTNGMGMTKGLKGKRGLVNGTGLTNGNGLTNGAGLLRYYYLKKQKDTMEKDEFRKQERIYSLRYRYRREAIFTALLIIAILLIPVLLYVFSVDEAEGITIDGKFGDWMGYTKGEAPVAPALDPDIDIRGFRVVHVAGAYSFYVRVAGDALSGDPDSNMTDVFTFFLDSDRAQNTGYRINGLGADYLVQVQGRDNRVSGTTLSAYDLQRDPRGLDWNAWKPAGFARAACRGSEIEVQVPAYDVQGARTGPINAFIISKSFDDTQDSTDLIVSDRQGELSVTQLSAQKKVLQSLPDEHVLTLDLTAFGADVQLDGLLLMKKGDAEVDSVRVGASTYFLDRSEVAVVFSPALKITKGQSLTLDVAADLSSASPGQSCGFCIESIYDVKTDSAVTLKGSLVDYVGYVDRAPAKVVADGAFGDWSAALTPDEASSGITARIDVRQCSASRTGSEAAFYLKVQGEMMAGARIPAENPLVSYGPSTPSNGTIPSKPVPLPPVTGEDLAYILLDTDDDATTGYRADAIGADHLIEIKGKNGRITSKGVLEFQGTSAWQWNWSRLGTLEAETDARQMEALVDLVDMGINASGDINVVFWTTDWEGAKDATEEIAVAGPGTRGGTRSFDASITDTRVLMFAVSTAPSSIGPGSKTDLFRIDIINQGDTAVTLDPWDFIFTDASDIRNLTTQEMQDAFSGFEIYVDSGDLCWGSEDRAVTCTVGVADNVVSVEFLTNGTVPAHAKATYFFVVQVSQGTQSQGFSVQFAPVTSDIPDRIWRAGDTLNWKMHTMISQPFGDGPLDIPEFELLLLPFIAVIFVFVVLRKKKK